MSAANGETEIGTGLIDSDASMKPFLDILADSSSSNMNLSTVRSLALKVFAHPQIFCGFDDFKSRCSPLLLSQGEKSSTTSSPSRSLFNTLDLFSFGTLQDYTANQQTDKEYYLPLNEPAMVKLNQLTVLTCIQKACSDGGMSISYDTLAEALGSTSSAAMQEDGASSTSSTGIANTRDIEAILIRCVYAGVLKGKLCQKTRSFSWRGERLPISLSRDVLPEHIPDLLSALEGLGQRLEESGNDVAVAQEHVTQGLEETAQFWKSVQSREKESLEKMHAKGGGAPGGGGLLGSRFFSGGRQGAGTSLSQGNTGSTSPGSGSQGINSRRSSKRSRGGMLGNFPMDQGGGYRM